MKRRILFIILILTIVCTILAPSVCAASQDELIAEQETSAGIQSASEAIPTEVTNTLDKLGIDPEHPTAGMRSFSLSDLIGILKSELLGVVSVPLRSLAAILAVIFLTSMLSSEKHRVLRAAGTAGAGVAVIAPVAALAVSAAETVSVCSVFISASIPVFGALTVSGGYPVSSAFMSGCMVALSEALSIISSSVLVPIACVGLAFSAVGAFVPEMKTEKLASGIRSFAIWSVGGALALYLTFIGIQSGITSSLDGLAKKTVNVTVSSVIPVVGRIISDASDTVLGAAELIKSGFGGFSLVVILLIFAKPLLTAIVWAVTLRIADFAASSFGADDISSLTGAAQKTVTVLIAVLASVAVALTVSVAVIVRLKG